MRVASYNIRHGAPTRAGLRGHLARTGALSGSVSALGADIVALQEVDHRVVRSWLVDQATRTARASGLAPHFSPARAMWPVGRYGIALLSRWPVSRLRTLSLPGSGEPRVASFARVESPEPVTVVCTHLQNPAGGAPSEASVQLDALLAELVRWPEPWIVMGDLNLRPDAVTTVFDEVGLDPARAGPTFPAHRPRVEIDWIAVRGLQVLSCEVIDIRTSDHRPLVAELVAEVVADVRDIGQISSQ